MAKWGACGTFDGHCVVGVVLCRLMNFASRPVPVYRCLFSASDEVGTYLA